MRNGNPLNVWAEGAAQPGARVKMRFVDAGGGRGKLIAQTVTIAECVPGERLAWVGHIPLIFTGRHFFELRAEGNGTALTHGEELSGFYPATFSAARLARQREAYEAVNRALARRVAWVASP
ncbi:MAG TPA: hypothetical protein VH331_16720 [Allosphingosinicella sp.]|jgi:hypothetical protein|nr:hypothetical protein [Allosphingosinicella sp.]